MPPPPPRDDGHCNYYFRGKREESKSILYISINEWKTLNIIFFFFLKEC